MKEQPGHGTHNHEQQNEDPRNTADHTGHVMNDSDVKGHGAMDHTGHGADAGEKDAPMEHGEHTGHVMAESDAKGHGAMDHAGHGADAGSHGAHVDHTGHELMFRKRFRVSLVLAIPVLLYSSTIQGWLDFTMPTFSGSTWLTPVFAVIIFLYGSLPFLQMAPSELRQRQPGMMTLISLSVSVAFVYSLLAYILDLGEGFFWEVVTLIVVMLPCRWLPVFSHRGVSCYRQRSGLCSCPSAPLSSPSTLSCYAGRSCARNASAGSGRQCKTRGAALAARERK